MQSSDRFLPSGVILLVSLSRRTESFHNFDTFERCVYPEEAVITGGSQVRCRVAG